MDTEKTETPATNGQGKTPSAETKPVVDQLTDIAAEAASQLAEAAVKSVAKRAKKAVAKRIPTSVKKGLAHVQPAALERPRLMAEPMGILSSRPPYTPTIEMQNCGSSGLPAAGDGPSP